MYEIAKANKWLFTDEKAKELLKSKEWHCWCDYGKDEKFLVCTPYIPLFITPPINNE